MGASGSGNTRFAVGDRVFLSSDHNENNAGGVSHQFLTGIAFGLIRVTSVNRAGSVPPVAADALSGAVVGVTSGNGLTLEAMCNNYWQGITFNSGTSLNLNASGNKRHYFRNCVLALIRTTTGDKISTNNPVGIVLDNTVMQFSNVGQGVQFGSYLTEFNWINTPSAIGGTAVPTLLFAAPGLSIPSLATLRGVDLSALTTSLAQFGSTGDKILLDSCRIASGLTRVTGTPNATDEAVELVNCYDGTNIISERHTTAGDLTTNRSTTMVGGAQDDVGPFSHQMVSGTRSDAFSLTLDSFWMDVENTVTGASKTATVEIVSSASLNNTDISLQLEYLGTSGSSLASFSSSLPSALTASAAVPTSTATWNSPPATPVYQHLQVTFTAQTAGRLRGIVRLGKTSTTVYVNPVITVT